jgi:hypothetical protein
MDLKEWIEAWARTGRVPPNWDFLTAEEREWWYVEIRRSYAEEKALREQQEVR